MGPLFTRHRPSGSRRAGQGEPILLVHPFMLSHHSWRPVLQSLSARHDVLAVSMPGHYGGPGLSWRSTFDQVVDHVEQEMDRVGWRTAHVVGNSLGGWATLELARRGRARTATAIAPAGGYEAFGVRDVAMAAAFVLAATTRTTMRATNLLPHLPAQRLALKTVAHHPGLLDRADARHVVRTALGVTHPLQVLLACARSIPVTGLEDIDVPVHLVFAEHDLVIPPARYAAYFTQRLPRARVTHLADVGHCPQVEQPELVADLVRETVAWGSPVAQAHAT